MSEHWLKFKLLEHIAEHTRLVRASRESARLAAFGKKLIFRLWSSQANSVRLIPVDRLVLLIDLGDEAYDRLIASGMHYRIDTMHLILFD